MRAIAPAGVGIAKSIDLIINKKTKYYDNYDKYKIINNTILFYIKT